MCVIVAPQLSKIFALLMDTSSYCTAQLVWDAFIKWHLSNYKIKVVTPSLLPVLLFKRHFEK